MQQSVRVYGKRREAVHAAQTVLVISCTFICAVKSRQWCTTGGGKATDLPLHQTPQPSLSTMSCLQEYTTIHTSPTIYTICSGQLLTRQLLYYPSSEQNRKQGWSRDARRQSGFFQKRAPPPSRPADHLPGLRAVSAASF